MTSRQANGSKFKPLSEAQISVLKWHTTPSHIPLDLPWGVYRSLIIRGYLRRYHGGYELTPEGRKRAYGLQWSMT